MAIEGKIEQILPFTLEKYGIDKEYEREIKKLLVEYSFTDEYSNNAIKNYEDNSMLIDSKPEDSMNAHIIGTKYHICLSNIVYESIFNLFVLLISGGMCIGNVIGLIFSLKKNIIKLSEEDFCLYLKIIQHKLDDVFSYEDVKSCMFNNECNNHTDIWKCRFLGEEDKCSFSEDKIEKVLALLCSKKIIEVKGIDSYKVIK